MTATTTTETDLNNVWALELRELLPRIKDPARQPFLNLDRETCIGWLAALADVLAMSERYADLLQSTTVPRLAWIQSELCHALDGFLNYELAVYRAGHGLKDAGPAKAPPAAPAA